MLHELSQTKSSVWLYQMATFAIKAIVESVKSCCRLSVEEMEDELCSMAGHSLSFVETTFCR